MIKAKCTKRINPWPEFDTGLTEGVFYDVDYISMGQSSTSVFLVGSAVSYNSLCFKFYEDDKEIDIFQDPRFNPYIKIRIKS